MRHILGTCVALLMVAAAPLAAGVRHVATHPEEPVDANESTGLFVGIRQFTLDTSLTEVRYGVDDAVDLAYFVAVDADPRLVEPNRVVLALAGEPQKPESKRRLDALLAAGAVRRFASQSDILSLLEDQSRAVGSRGILIVDFATHGISYEGVQYLFAATSLLRHRETAIAETTIRDIVSTSKAERSVTLIDACRQRLASDTREGQSDPRAAAAPLLKSLARIEGHVIFSAAAPGQYAYDDDAQRNGVFTAAVIDGLRCRAHPDARGFITVEALAAYVDERVLTWIQRNRDPKAHKATQLSAEGRSNMMPLAQCPGSYSQRHGRSSREAAGATDP
jgi:hypothetical protein